ncbi:UDP-2,4-diacetamido-2,4,6-trideoxy-beta-L-altropyranose hydrolase [Halalkalibacterium ligniniphilum]|uniref:UDP-2,4-diacetamido-2,4, 6-trideoxy-beta-L-altropyranose hydrolase n=1 Tax=Halalkalibacterium ligniniphilum TaxID=1134413 RepID=UPI0003464F1F|nr:UDP-2,4-diacetamido-2,4,6-trideoxy-beta-L-altropyranose hydrolase [Halalkalibacterium ligniniphilum]
MKTAVFRVDSSVEIGTGHVMRCLTLAEELKEKGYHSIFVTRKHEGSLSSYIADKGFQVELLNAASVAAHNDQDLKHSHWLGVHQKEDVMETLNKVAYLATVDLLVVDHYGIDYRWESMVRASGNVQQLFVIDDLADRKHNCDLLLDQNYYPNMRQRYDGLVNKDCKLLLGPSFALLRKEFKVARKNLSQWSGPIERVLIFFGGTDPTNETMKVLKAISRLAVKDIIFDVIVGASNPKQDVIKELTASLEHVHFYCQVTNMAELMVKADLAIGAGGSTTWERCYLGLPALTIDVAENQSEILEALHNKCVLHHLGKSRAVSADDVARHFYHLIENQELLKHMSTNALALMSEETDYSSFF